MIEQVRQENWNPDQNDSDKQHRDALAARGYWQAFQAVEQSIQKVLKGSPSGDVVDKDHGKWYRQLFAPSV